MKPSEVMVQSTTALAMAIVALIEVLNREGALPRHAVASYLRAMIDALPPDMRSGPYAEVLQAIEAHCAGSAPLPPEELVRRILH